MAVRPKRIGADTLIGLALATLRDEIAPALPPDKRYASAMLANALEIARRDIGNDADTPLWPLLDAIYDEETAGSPRKLAADIRAGTVSEETLPDLGGKLLAVLETELAINNPRFLAKAK